MSALSAIGSSGLAASQARLDVSAHNVANVATPNFRPQEVVQSQQAGGGVQAEVRTSDAQETRLEQELVEQHVALYNFQANVLSVKTSGAVVGSLLDCTA